MSKGGYQNILVITDHFTSYAQAIPTRNQTARTTAEAMLDGFIARCVYVVRSEDSKGPKGTLHRNLLLPIGSLPVQSEHNNRKQEKHAFKYATSKAINSPNNNFRDIDSDKYEKYSILPYLPSDNEMIGVSGSSETANTRDMSVMNSVVDDVALENSITVSSSKSLIVNDEIIQTMMMVIPV
ncbi:hypothetical protein CHS0354_004243 [Potamilus streckersoni]|uniref:Uncharacterized protein n=1 Tax=Potamilus streckersoni TaxID=2493646 RepID=A0AAE0VQA2_9BIVA|nr:hypothetical protein CHS0354_004243 [Potamilus streckersoni]